MRVRRPEQTWVILCAMHHENALGRPPLAVCSMLESLRGRLRSKSSARALGITIQTLASAAAAIPGTVAVSPDMRHVAWFEIGLNGQYQLVRDGRSEPIDGQQLLTSR